MVKFDLIDKKLSSALDRNARNSVSRLSKQLKLSRDTIKYRMDKLERDGIIRGYKAVIDTSRLGKKIYRVYLKFYSIPKEEHQGLVKSLVEDKSVFWVGETDGFVDLVFGVFCNSTHDFNIFYRRLIERCRQFIKQEYVHEVITYSYLDWAYILRKKQEQRQENSIGGNEKAKYDANDMIILDLLSKNARVPLIDIAEKLKMESASVIYRIKQLEKQKIILGYKADIDISKINRHFYTVKAYLSDFKNKKALMAYLKSIPAVVNLTEAIGSWDVEVDLEVESDEEYHKIIDDLKDYFSCISEILFFRAPKIYKSLSL